MEEEELQNEILKLKREKKALILAHYYQRPEVQDIADFVGDSLELSRKAANIPEALIVFCGVTFMAEVAKILSPQKTVLIPYPKAGCLLADMAEPGELAKVKRENPGVKVVAYVNTYADVKAESDIICTSANAGDVIRKVEGGRVLFIPDKNLGAYHARFVKEKEIILWDGYCPVHQRITQESILRAKERYPDALVVVHPECPPQVTEMADFVGSTSQLVRFVRGSEHRRFIVGTEEGTLHQMRGLTSGKEFLLPDPPPICDQMKMITLERVYKSLKEEIYPTEVEEETRSKAERAIRRMLEL